jgi:hypothetical protein
MWLLSWIREGKQHKMLFQDMLHAAAHCKANEDTGIFIEKVQVFVPKDPSPKKESTSSQRLIPLSDTIAEN